MMHNRRAQVISEYIMIMLLAVFALASLQLYFQRAIKSMVRTSADEYGSQEEALEPQWRSPSVSKTMVRRAQSQSATTSIARSATGERRVVQYGESSTVVPLDTGEDSYSTQVTLNDR